MSRSALVLDGGSGPALAVVRSLGRAGWRVLAEAGSRAARSRYAVAVDPLPTWEVDAAAWSDALVEVVLREEADVVVPCTDASVSLAWARAEELAPARILGGDRAGAALALDKAAVLAAAEANGFGVPAWVAPADLVEAHEALARIGLPAVVKPRRTYVADGTGLRQRRHSFVRDPAELDRRLAAQAEPDGALPVLEAFVPGRSLSATVVLRGGRLLALVARETRSFLPVAGGNSVWKRTIDAGEPGVREAVELLRGVGYEGLAEVEFQLDAAGVPRLMEIGPRVHGWIPLTVHAGVDVPLIAARALLGDELPEAAPYRVGAEMRWPHGELERLRIALRGDSLPPGMRRRDVVAAAWPPWRPGMAYDGLDLGDPGPWLPLSAARRRRARQ